MERFLNNDNNFNIIQNDMDVNPDEFPIKNKNTYVTKEDFQKNLEGDSAKENVQALSIEEQMEEFMFLGLRMKAGVTF